MYITQISENLIILSEIQNIKKGKGKGKGGGYSLISTSMTCSADFTSTFPGIGTHTNTISSP